MTPDNNLKGSGSRYVKEEFISYKEALYGGRGGLYRSYKVCFAAFKYLSLLF